MAKSIRSFLSLLLVLQLIIPYSTFAAAVGEFTSVVGDVMQTRATEVIRPAAKSPIELEDLIATDRASSTSMVFSDDSTILLAENTKLEIKEFLFKDKSRTGIFSLMIGKVTAAVKKYVGGDNVFEVHSPTAVVGVRGTGFEFIEAMKGGNVGSPLASQRMATVSCMDGSLTVSSLSSTGAVISTMVIEAGQMAVIIGGVITISKIGGAAAGGSSVAAGGAAAATGLSTAAIVGISIGGAVIVGGAAAVIGGGSGSSGGVISSPCADKVGIYYLSGSGRDCQGNSDTGSFSMSVSANCSCSFRDPDPNVTSTCSISGNNFSGSSPSNRCGTTSLNGTFSGNLISGSYSFSYGGGGTFSGSR